MVFLMDRFKDLDQYLHWLEDTAHYANMSPDLPTEAIAKLT